MLPEYSHLSARTVEDAPQAKRLVCAVGDIHGSLAKLKDLVVRCERFADGAPLTFVFLGDYIDRGADSGGVVRYLMTLHSRLGKRMVALKGNHEAMLLDVVDGACSAQHWESQGGEATLRSYGAARAEDLPETHINWLRSLPLSYDDGRRFYVHAGINPLRPFDSGKPEGLYGFWA